MADVRSLLRNERAARRINHPQAQYTSTGGLTCKACRLQIKSDALWRSHISSPQHINSLKGLASGLMAKPATKGMKRKAEDDSEDDEESSRKRTRAVEGLSSPVTVQNEPEFGIETREGAREAAFEHTTKGAVNEKEWEAFEREMASTGPEDTSPLSLKYSTAATISAAPVSAAELAAKSVHEESVQLKERREAEIEQDKEDAQRRLEEEFDEMEELEARVRRLKDQREALRRKPQAPSDTLHQDPNKPSPSQAVQSTMSAHDEETDDGVEDDDDDYDNWDNWGAT